MGWQAERLNHPVNVSFKMCSGIKLEKLYLHNQAMDVCPGWARSVNSFLCTVLIKEQEGVGTVDRGSAASERLTRGLMRADKQSLQSSNYVESIFSRNEPSSEVLRNWISE